MKNLSPLFASLFISILILSGENSQARPSIIIQVNDTTHFDRDYDLEATMLGFFAKDGTRNPTLRANKGDRVRIKITNGEIMTHDIALEKLGLKSKTILERHPASGFW